MFSQEAFVAAIKPAAIFTFGIAIYSLVVFYFYKFLARRDTFSLNLQQYNKAKHPLIEKFFGVIFYLIEYILFFPLIASFWFAVLTFLLAFLAKDPIISKILLISVSVVAAVRITAYISEDLSHDLAKMLPFALLGIYLVDTNYLNIAQTIVLFKQVPAQLEQVLYSFLFLVGLEAVLRFANMFTLPFRESEEE